MNVVRLIEFVDIDVNGITFPATEEFDVVLGNAVSCGSDSCTLSNRVAGEPKSGNTSLKE